MQRLRAEVGRGRREGSPSGSGPCARDGATLREDLRGLRVNPWVWAHQGLVPVEPPQRGGEGKAAPAMGQTLCWTPDGLRSQTDGADLTSSVM